MLPARLHEALALIVTGQASRPSPHGRRPVGATCPLQVPRGHPFPDPRYPAPAYHPVRPDRDSTMAPWVARPRQRSAVTPRFPDIRVPEEAALESRDREEDAT